MKTGPWFLYLLTDFIYTNIDNEDHLFFRQTKIFWLFLFVLFFSVAYFQVEMDNRIGNIERYQDESEATKHDLVNDNGMVQDLLGYI